MAYRSHLRAPRSLNDSRGAAKETAAGLDAQRSLTSHHGSWDWGTNLLWVKTHGNREAWKKDSFALKHLWLFRNQWLLLETVMEPKA